MKTLNGIFLVNQFSLSLSLPLCLAGYDSEGKKLMKQLGIDEQLASLTSVPPTKSALDIWQVGEQHGI